MVNNNILFRMMFLTISKSIQKMHHGLVAQLFGYQTSVWKVVGSNPGQTNIQGLYINEEKVLPL